MNVEKHIFISYSHSDALLATTTATALARARVPFFIDRVGLSPGDSLRARLGEALDDAAAVIAILTKHSVQSTWVRRELALLSERGARIIPVRCDDSEWPTSIGLTLGDALYVDGRDPVGLAGRIPKVFHDRFPQLPAGGAGRFFKLAARPRAPYAQFFPGTVQTALEEIAFGRVAVVVPTDTGVNLGGKVTTSLLDFLGVDPTQLEHLRKPISSREVCDLGEVGFQGTRVQILASTVFNSQGSPHSEDQWRAAAAVLGRAQDLGCATLLVPPMGTGVYGWPRSAALQHWLYGAIRWVISNPLATEEWTWPVICGPGAGAQRMFLQYLDRVDASALKRLENRQFEFVVEYKGIASPPTLGYHDAMLGSVVGQACPELRGRRDLKAAHPADDPGRQGRELRYDLGTPLNKTAFADGDTIQILER